MVSWSLQGPLNKLCKGSAPPRQASGVGVVPRPDSRQEPWNGWVAGGCWDDYETSDEMDHSRKFPAI